MRGDVFLIPIANDEKAYAQVIGTWERTFLVVAFRATDRDAPPIDVALTRDLILAGTVFDAKLANGDWPIKHSRACCSSGSRSYVFLLPSPSGCLNPPGLCRHRRGSHPDTRMSRGVSSESSGSSSRPACWLCYCVRDCDRTHTSNVYNSRHRPRCGVGGGCEDCHRIQVVRMPFSITRHS